MVINCAIPSCHNTQRGRKFSFFRFPKEKSYREAWAKVCSKNIKSVEHARVCSIHFRPECFVPRSAALEYIDQVLNRTPRRVLKLTPTAIPTEYLSEDDSIIGQIEDNEFVEEYIVPETINGASNDDGSSEEVNIDSKNIIPEASTSDNSNAFDYEVSFEIVNNDSSHEAIEQIKTENDRQQNETSPQKFCTNDNLNHQPLDENNPSEDYNTVIDRIFSTLPDCNFTIKQEREIYLQCVDQVKREIHTKMMELQDVIEKEQEKNKIQLKEIEILKAKRRKDFNHFLIQFLQAKKNKMYWKKKCLAYKIKFYEAKNKE